METRRWLNQAQPQTLVIACLLMYFDAVMGALFGGLFNALSLAIIIASVAAGYGISNERKWGYWLGIAVSVFYLLPFVLNLLAHGSVGGDMIGLLFAVAKFALLVHPQSREYQKIWFK